MAATATQTLISEASCYLCVGISIAQAVKLALMARTLLALSPTADVSRQSLLAYAHCFACLGMSVGELMEMALLDQISQAV